MNTNIFKLIMAIIAMFFVVATSTAQETKTMYIMKNGAVIRKVSVSDIDSLIFRNLDDIEINGVVWATRNVGTPGTFVDKPEDAGMFYQWNRSKGWAATGYYVSGWDSSIPTGTTWETANNVCPAGYRVPTDVEIQSLMNSYSRWTTQNGVDGYVFGRGGNTIFLPAAGWRYSGNGTLFDAGSSCNYWSSTPNGNDYAFSLDYNSNYERKSSTIRSIGLSVRCVAE